MDTKTLSTLLSHLLPLLLLAGDHHHSPPFNPLPHLLLHFISISQTTALLSPNRKRSQSQSQSSDRSKRPKPNSPIPKSPDSFNLFFKMTSSSFEWLSSLLEPLLDCRDPLNSPLNLPVQTRLGIGLFRLATGSDYPHISQRFNVSLPVAKFCVNQFCRVLCTNFRFWVGFPTPDELNPIAESFQSLSGLPNCCGVLLCTRFMVSKPGSIDELEREQEPIAAQIVSDSSSKILNIVAGFNGRKSNQQILKSTSLYSDIESNKLLNTNSLNSPPVRINSTCISIPQYLIGDRGYPLLPWLMVPFDEPVANSDQEKFNSAHDLMMVSGFRTVDSLRKWGVLSKPIREEIKTMAGYIGACSILHNALLTREDYSSLSDKSDEDLRVGQSFEDRIGVGLKDDLVEGKVFEIRNALATRARRCQ